MPPLDPPLKPSPSPPLACPGCGSANVKLATDAIYTVYLRCAECFHVWSMTKDEYGRARKDGERQ